MRSLVLYNRARRAIAAAVAVDEVKDVIDKSVALKAYARQSKDQQLMADATEINRRAVRRLGEIMADQRAAGELPEGRPKRGPGNPVFPTLESQGVDKNLAKRARAAAALPEEKFEAAVAKVKRVAVATVVGDHAVLAEVRADRNREKQARRRMREQQLGARQLALPDRRYGVILADPPWRWEPWSRETGLSKAADNHYPTQETAAIATLDVASIAAPDCVLFLWATAPMLPQALDVMKAWGFGYRTNCVWCKPSGRPGTGYWFRNHHEHLLLGAQGDIPAPAMGMQWPSAIEAALGRHSEKPAAFFELIEAYFPSLPKIELYRRGKARAGWSAWGLEAYPEAAE